VFKTGKDKVKATDKIKKNSVFREKRFLLNNIEKLPKTKNNQKWYVCHKKRFFHRIL